MADQSKIGLAGNRIVVSEPAPEQRPAGCSERPCESEETIDVDDHQALLFYEELKEAGWEICGQPIEGLRQLQNIISERFTTAPPWNQRYYWNTFKVFLGRSCDLETAGDNNYEFWATFRNDRDKPASSGWKIDGQFYPMSQQTEAIEAFLATASER